jgi:ribonuclease P/MRP protein subunit RPP1
MKRRYADLHLYLDLRDSEQISRMVANAEKLGYGLIGVVLSPNISDVEFQRLRDICEDATIDVVCRVDLKPRTPRELLRDLRRFRRRFEIVAVLCENKDVARQAAKDRRVDLLNFPSADFRRRFFDRAEAELASNGLACFEIDMKPLVCLEGAVRVRLLANLRREALIAREFRVPIVVSSGVSDGWLMRAPRDLASLAGLFDLDEVSAIEAVSRVPVGMVKRNREKLCWRFVAPGIRVIRRGKDC